jgi:hypothetical protein
MVGQTGRRILMETTNQHPNWQTVRACAIGPTLRG